MLVLELRKSCDCAASATVLCLAISPQGFYFVDAGISVLFIPSKLSDSITSPADHAGNTADKAAHKTAHKTINCSGDEVSRLFPEYVIIGMCEGMCSLHISLTYTVTLLVTAPMRQTRSSSCIPYL